MDIQEIVDRRREIVRHWWFIGTAVQTIVENLERRHDECPFFSPTDTYKTKCRIIKKDIEAIKQKAATAVVLRENDAQEAHSIYVTRAQYLFEQALQQGDLHLARELNKDIAKARGIQTEEPITVKNDLLSMFMRASAEGEKKVLARQQAAIDITPEPVPSGLSTPPPEEGLRNDAVPVEKKEKQLPAMSILHVKASD